MYRSSRLHILLLSLPAAIIPFCNGASALFCSETEQHSDSHAPLFHLQQELEQGDKLYEAGLTSKAIASYRQVIDALDHGAMADPSAPSLLMQARFNLAQALIAEEETATAADLLKKNADTPPPLPDQAETFRRRSLFHLALVQKQLQNYSEAKEALKAYLLLPPPLEENDEAVFESGLIDYLMGNYPAAGETLETFRPADSKRHLRTLADLYLARIALAEGKENEAAERLDLLAGRMKRGDPLLFEVDFLRGETAFRLHDYIKAANHYNSSLPPGRPELCKWNGEACYRQGLCYMQLAEMPDKKREELSSYYDLAEESLKKMSGTSLNEDGYLALAQCYLARVGRLKQTSYYAKAEELLSRNDLFTSSEGKTHALLLRAGAAPSYAIRDKYYKQLTKSGDKESALYAKGWLMRALNDFEQGVALLKKGDSKEGQRILEEASKAFRRTFELTKNVQPSQAGEALKLEAVALGYSDTPEGNRQSVAVLQELMDDNPEAWKRMESPNEVLYLHGYYTGRLAAGADRERYLAAAASSLYAAASHQDDRFADQALCHLAGLYFESGSYPEAESAYLRLAETFPASPYVTESWVWAARCAEQLGRGPEAVKERRKRALEQGDVRSPFAAEAYFTYYTYQEYLQGDRGAIRHLQGFEEKYPESPFLIEAYYLIGLDNKRDRKNEEGKWIRKKSLTDAIDAFQKAESLYDDLAAKKLIPKEKLDYYTAMRYRATFERAMANLSIANDAHAAKRQIYLDYAEEVFENLLADLNDGKKLILRQTEKEGPEASLREECTFWLAQTYIKGGKDGEAELVLKGMADGYNRNGTTRSYYLARTLGEQGRMAMRRSDFSKALQLLRSAEEAGRGGLLSTDQRLDVSIQQSLCCRSLGQFDDSILILSKVINDDAVSSLRVKAMYLRAETYELQKRPELAKKQLESMVKKGGAWALKAQEKLEKDYLNHGN